VRQTIEGVVLGAGYRGVRTENLTSWYCARSHSEHGFCEGTHELGSRYKVLLSTDEGSSRYNAMDLTAEKPFSAASRWGFTLAYTLADGKRKGWDFFTFDFLDDPATWPMVRSPIERHRITASGIVGLPYDFRLSTLAQWGSGTVQPHRRITRLGPGTCPDGLVHAGGRQFPAGRPAPAEGFQVTSAGWPYRPGRGGGQRVRPRELPQLSAVRRLGRRRRERNFGKPELWSADPGRRLQLGLDFRF
jgi:hypothetical protein